MTKHKTHNTLLLTLLAASLCFSFDLSGFHDYTVGDSFTYQIVTTNSAANDPIKEQTKSRRHHIVDSIQVFDSAVVFYISYEEIGQTILYNNNTPYDTVAINHPGTETFIVENGRLVGTTDFFPLQNSFSEDELDTMRHRYGILHYAGEKRNFLRFDHRVAGPGGYYYCVFYGYLSGFGTIYQQRGEEYGVTGFIEDKLAQLIKYNNVFINPDSLDTLMLNPTAISHKRVCNKHSPIQSVQKLIFTIKNSKESDHLINITNIMGRNIASNIRINRFQQIQKELPSGLYIISGHIRNRPFFVKLGITR